MPLVSKMIGLLLQGNQTYVHLYLFSIGIFYRRIVGFYPYILHKLRRETALSDTSCHLKSVPVLPVQKGKGYDGPAPRTTM
jgi:hypothetical protein